MASSSFVVTTTTTTTATTMLVTTSSVQQEHDNNKDNNSSHNGSIITTNKAKQQQHATTTPVKAPRHDLLTTMSTPPTSHASVCLTRSNSIALLEATTTYERILYGLLGLIVGVAVYVFAVTFPLWLFPAAAVPTYQPAGYVYDATLSHFDNTAWTYGTDYAIAVAMLYQIYCFPRVTTTRTTAVLQFRSQALLASYACSVVAGGYCHAHYTTLEARNTWHFRLLWTVCVGSVTVGVTILGSIATELVRCDERIGLAWVPAVPAWCWVGIGTTCTVACAAGYLSYQRPACDIFVAGVAQSIPTFYIMAQLARGLPTHAALTAQTRVLGCIAFVMMSATLPTYPLAIQYTSWSLGTINAALHAWLCVAWSAQGATLRQIVLVLAQQEQQDNGTAAHPRAMIPLKKNCRHKVA